MARVTGLEPATSGVTGRRSNQLSYTRLREAAGLGDPPYGVKQKAAGLLRRPSQRERNPYLGAILSDRRGPGA